MTIRSFCILVCCILVTGCGGERLVKVTGVATRTGKPMPNLVINFSPEIGLRSFALTDADGKFKMVISGEKKPARWVRNLSSITVVTIE